MKKLNHSLILIILCVIFSGCPYESTVPIDKPSVKIDSNIIGNWIDKQNSNEIYKVSKQDDNTYKIIKTQKDSDKIEEYLAYFSKVNKSTFLNLWENLPQDKRHKYAFYKMEIESESKIRLSEVSENIDEIFTSSVELKKFIEENMHNSYFFGKDEMILERMK